MKKVIIDGFIFSYKIELNENQKNDMYIRVKNKEYVVVTVNKKMDELEIEKVLQKRISFLKERLPKTLLENIIHVKGVPYTPHFIVSSFPYVQIMGNNIVIGSPQTDVASYHKVLYDFYEEIIKEELSKIIEEAKIAFREIKFPTISLKYYKSNYGMYEPTKHHITLSSMLGKYDVKQIKLTLYHELCHVLVPNHSKKFYDYFETKIINAKQLDLSSRKVHYFDCL